jgi:ferredoxin
MRVVVDFDLCQSHALCTEAAPDVFEIDDAGLLNVKVEHPPERLRKAVERAVNECPTNAIRLEEDGRGS